MLVMRTGPKAGDNLVVETVSISSSIIITFLCSPTPCLNDDAIMLLRRYNTCYTTRYGMRRPHSQQSGLRPMFLLLPLLAPVISSWCVFGNNARGALPPAGTIHLQQYHLLIMFVDPCSHVFRQQKLHCTGWESHTAVGLVRTSNAQRSIRKERRDCCPRMSPYTAYMHA